MKRHVEYDSCVALIKWWGYAHKGLGVPEGLLIHIPNQAGGNPRTGMHLKRMGVRKGAPDYLLLTGNPLGFKGLALEIKTATGKLSPEQMDFHKNMTAMGYMIKVCRSCQEARIAIEQYIKGNNY